MGLFGLFGKKVKAPQIQEVKLADLFAPTDSVLGGALTKTRNLANQNLDQAAEYTAQLPGLTAQLGEAPTLQGADLAEYETAQNTFKSFLDLARTNTLNENAIQMKTAGRAMGVAGFNAGGVGEANIMSGIASKNQANLNNIAAQTAAEMTSYRSNLLSNVYNRLLTRYNATTSQAAQTTAQSQSLMGNVYNVLSGERTYKTTLANQNAQMKFAADVANQQSQQSAFSSLLSAGTSIFSAFLGKK